MAEEQFTHIIYLGRHYVFPGKMGPDEARVRVQNLAGGGPKIQTGAPGAAGFEDTSAEVADILKRRREPNLPQDVIPKLAEFASLGYLGSLGSVAGKGVAALRGLNAADKARRVAVTAAKAAGYGVAGVTANEGLKAVGVPAGASEAIVTAAGMRTTPGRAMLRAGMEALAGESAAVRVAPAVAARAVPSAVSTSAPVMRFPSATSTAGAAVPAAASATTEAETELARQLRASIERARLPVPKAVSQAEEIAGKILTWKTQNGWSGAQMESALRNVYGISPKDGRQMIRMVLESAGVL